jgi:hypothetical protein
MRDLRDVATACEFVVGVDLHGLGVPTTLETEAEPINYDAVKTQTLVVGSDIVSFVKGITVESRQDIANSALLAQLVAKKKVPEPARIYDWYREYFNVLSNVGWVIQEQGFTEYTAASDDAEVHNAALEVAASLLGPGATTLQVVKATLDALKSASAHSPWITLFHRESQQANAAKFQITLAYKGDNDDLLVSLMAFGLEAETTITQVLVFKFKSSRALLKKYSGSVSVNTQVLSGVRQAITDKISAFTNSYIKQLPDLG